MPTEMTPLGASIKRPLDVDGVPMDNRLYVPSLTQYYHLGARHVSWDGKVFKYAKSGGACYTGRGNKFYNAIPATGIDYSLLAADAALGDTTIKMTNQGTVAQTKDGLIGGHIVLKPLAASGDDVLQFRGVVANTAGGVSDVITIELDHPLSAALTTLSYAFVMPSPWSDIRYDASLWTSVAGLAAANVTAANYFHFEQTWGMCWIAPQTDLGQADSKRQCVFRHDGSVGPHDDSDVTYEEYAQHAGFVMDNNAAANGATMFMLQITPV